MHPTEEVEKYNQEENKARSPAFQSWDDILETMHGTSIYRMLSNDLQVKFSVILYHKHPSEPSPLVLEVQVPATMVSTANHIAKTIRLFRNQAFDTIYYDILDAPFYLVCKEEVEHYDYVVAKHGSRLVGAWFERNVRLGDAKFFTMAAEMKCFEERRSWVDEEMTVWKLGAVVAPVKSIVTGE